VSERGGPAVQPSRMRSDKVLLNVYVVEVVSPPFFLPLLVVIDVRGALPLFFGLRVRALCLEKFFPFCNWDDTTPFFFLGEVRGSDFVS